MQPVPQVLTPVPHSKPRGLAGVMNRWQREAPTDPTPFNARLETTWPRTDGTWFRAVWEPGRDGEQVERWMLYEMWPIEAIADDLAAEFRGTDPARLTFIDSVTGAVVPQTTITRTQWKLYQDTGWCGRLAWVVQGAQGGHKRVYSQLERQVLKMMGLPVDPPIPGALPFAPLDERVITQLLRHDRLRKAASSTDALVRIGAMTRADGQREIRRHMVRWIAEQSRDWDVDRVGKAASAASATPRTDTDWVRAHELACETYIDTGRFEAPPETSRIFLLR